MDMPRVVPDALRQGDASAEHQRKDGGLYVPAATKGLPDLRAELLSSRAASMTIRWTLSDWSDS
jgi:hypothetical protein